ncbi:ABC transporter permease [Chitinophaga defluvii]|uniref:ABC transporter permease n=1 Tax=Chitinophaga defluvii TaxID=3163343 RepID=A0ABV2T201_9BACT
MKLSSITPMLKNYLKIAFRNLWANKGFSAINIGGLAIGIAACLAIFQYVGFELSYDQFHPKGKQLYRVTKKYMLEGVLADHSAMTYTATGPAMQAAFPEVIGATTVSTIYGSAVMSYEHTRFNEEKILFADSAFLQLFHFPLLRGKQTDLNDSRTALLSASTAKKYFGKTDPVGKIITLNKTGTYLVKGIFKDVPPNAHLKFDFLLSAKYERNWNNFDYYTYLLLAPGTDPKALEAKFPAFIQQAGMDSTTTKFELQAMPDIHLHSNIRNEATVNGNIRSVYFLLIIAGFILAIAWVNYVNLSTAKAIRRAREVGIRKVVGAGKQQLLAQFLLESILVNFIAAMIAAVLLMLTMPYFANLTGKPLADSLWGAPAYWLLFVMIFLSGTLISGVYPAFILSSFQPIKVLKGSSKTAGHNTLRKALVIVQFAASVILLIGTFTIFRQLQFMRSQDLGMRLDQTLVVVGPKMADSSRIKAFKMELQREPAVSQLTISSDIPGKEIWSTNGAFRLSQDPRASIGLNEVTIDEDFLKTFQIKLLAGRNLSEAGGSDARDGALLNETACKALGFTSPESAIQQKINFQGDTLAIVGILKDYHQESLRSNVNPIIFRLGTSYNNFYAIRMNMLHPDKTIAAIGKEYTRFFPDDPYDYFFLDAYFDKQYRTDKQLGHIFLLFASLAIFVACLGLFGLASFTIQQRKKEISVRKVLGASVGNIVLLLSKDFLKLVMLAFLIAGPLAWYAMHKWLEDFAYRTALSWWIFALAGLVALIVAVLTVSTQAIKTALTNPVKSLRAD